jgi:hypothetical protein
MFGPSNSTPYDVPLLILLVALAVLLFIGAATASAWSPTSASVVRRGAIVVAIGAFVVVHVVTPTANGIIGAARMVFLWPALALTIVAFLVWGWRAGRA